MGYRKYTMTAAAGALGIVLLAGLMFLFSTPELLLAAPPAKAATSGDSHSEPSTAGAHLSQLSADPAAQRVDALLESVAAADNPHTGLAAHAPVSATLLDYQLPGTQPGGLIDLLADSSSCTGCHVDHIRDNFNGSMMTNGVRDPLFRAALVIANKDAEYGGDICIRCHSPNAWLNNRSAVPGDPASTDGHLINAEDLHGISCTACHRMVPPEPLTGEATGDAAERAALAGPFMLGNSAYIIDRRDVRRGPFEIVGAPHTVAQSSFLRSAEICATCHDIDNPLLTFDDQSGEFKLNPPNTPAAVGDRLFPLDRTYSEWKFSTFASSGVSGLDYPGLKRSTGTQDGPITVCQDCHMPMVTSPIANNGPSRTVGKHQWLGANTTWQDGIIQVWDNVAGDTRFDATQTANNKAASLELLQRAAQLDLAIVNGQLEVKITNNTGHKLPTGYAEGRRMWIEVSQLRGGTPVFTSGVMAGAVGPLIEDPYLKKYEVKLGLTESHAQAINRPELEGEGFHIILNNKVFKDNRIPPRGFTNAAFASRDMQPVGVTYADGQYWDTTYYPIHPEADQISVRLMYQTASSEYLDFLATEANFNVEDAVRGTTNWGQIISDLRSQDVGKPVAIASKYLLLPRLFVATSGTDTANPCTDSAQPCRTITHALTQAPDSAEIRVAAGVYAEPIQISKPISLTGGFTLSNWITPTWTVNETILDGQNSFRPLTIDAPLSVNGNTVQVNGFIIRNGNATGSDRRGGGIYIGPVNTIYQVNLTNLRLENNVASTTDDGEGGGLAASLGNTFNITAELTLNNVSVISNSASTGSLGSVGGGMSIRAAGTSALDVHMLNVTVRDNTAGNDFSSQGGGILMSLNGGTATLRQTRILNNHAARIKTQLGGPSRGGGIYLTDANLLLENVLIAKNDGERGEALWIESSGATSTTVTMNYVTIADNFRNSGGDAIRIDGSKIALSLANTLISGNPVAVEAQSSLQPPDLSFSSVLIDDNVTTVISGTINTQGTPLRGSAAYVNPGAGNYRLTAASDAVDKGNGQPPFIDLAGTIRPQGMTTDIGAYEFIPAQLQNQTITFAPIPDKVLGDPPFNINATASSGLPVSFRSLTLDICTVNGNTVTLVSSGTCSIQATQAGNATYNPAQPVVRIFAVRSTQKTDQTITFAQPPNKHLGDPPFALVATASSGLPVRFTVNTPATCSLNGSTVTLLAVGTCSITASQDGNAMVNPATPVQRDFQILPAGAADEQKIYLPLVRQRR